MSVPLSDRHFLVLIQLLIRCTMSKSSVCTAVTHHVSKVLSISAAFPLSQHPHLGLTLCYRAQQIFLALSFWAPFSPVHFPKVRLTWGRDFMSMSGALLVVPVYCCGKHSSQTSSTGKFCCSLICSEKLKKPQNTSPWLFGF